MMKIALMAGLLCLASPLSAAVVAIYSFDAQNGTDSAGGNTATPDATVTYSTNTPFGQGQGYAFNVSNGATLTAAHGTSSTFGSINNNLSVSFWIKAGTTGNADWNRVIRKGAGGANSWIIGRYNSTADLNIRVDTHPTSGQGYNQNLAFSSTGGTILTDEWHLVSYVLEYTSGTLGTVREYVDGVQLGATGTFIFAGGLGNTSALEMGVTSGNWTGLMDDVGIWNNALTAGEARSIYTLGSNGLFAYDLELVTQLHSLYSQGATGGGLDLNGFNWEYSNALSGSGHNPGDLYFNSSLDRWVLQMDSSTGLTAAAAPEPGRTLLVALSLTLLIFTRRRLGRLF